MEKKVNHDWQERIGFRFCYECGIHQRMITHQWKTVWPTFGPSFTKPFCEGEVEPPRPTLKVINLKEENNESTEP